MIEFDAGYYLAILLWLAALMLLLGQAWRGRIPVVGLSLAYWCSLGSIHLLGGLIQLLPWHVSPDRSDTIAGFRLTGYALAGLLIGNLLIDRRLFTRLPQVSKPVRVGSPLRELAINYVAIGLGVYFIVAELLAFFPSSSA